MKKIAIGVIAVAAMVCFSSVFIVDEGQKGIVVQFGKVKRVDSGEPRLYEPGLHFKVPLIDQVRKMDARIQTLEGQADRFVTSEKKDLIIDSYVKWKIEDFSKYYLATGGGNKIQAEDLLKRKINNGLRSEIGNRTIKDIVSGERSTVMEDALMKMARSSELGIKVVDVRIKQINLPVEVSSSIYQRMRAERTAVAREHRSQGREQAEILRADIDRKVTVMIADAESNARQLRGEGDAEAAKIYADAYGKDPEFYDFYRAMQSYDTTFAQDSQSGSSIILSPDNEYLKQFRGQR